MINNYYEAIAALRLGVGASEDEIKTAFRSLSKVYHPDVYKYDGGEAFKKINQAYQYLKRYPDAPKVQRSYTSHKQSTSNYSNQHQTERERRTARNKARNREKDRQKAAYYVKLSKDAEVIVMFVLIINSLLAIDYLLPNIESTSFITSAKKIDGEYIKVFFNDGNSFNFYMYDELSAGIKDNFFTYEKSMIFKQQMSLYDQTRNIPLTPGYNVLRVFSFLILIQALALWGYRRAKDINTKMNALVTMAFFIVLQLGLLIFR